MYKIHTTTTLYLSTKKPSIVIILHLIQGIGNPKPLPLPSPFPNALMAHHISYFIPTFFSIRIPRASINPPVPGLSHIRSNQIYATGSKNTSALPLGDI
jgi:hypothetical protein